MITAQRLVKVINVSQFAAKCGTNWVEEKKTHNKFSFNLGRTLHFNKWGQLSVNM